MFGIDIETCPACGGAVRIMPKALATLAGQALRKILVHLDRKDVPQQTGLLPEGRAPPGPPWT